MTSYLFYDLETTGLNKAFDQVLQFSGIRTDSTFKEIDRVNLAIRLRPDVIPSPGALITHRITMHQCLKGVPEYEAIGRIHRLLNTPGTVSLGYNTMGFDDEFLRFSFHRNLFPPYTHQYQNGCRRMDILPVAILFYLFKKEALIWPEVNGKPTMKLEHLSTANDLASGRAHDAQTDVIATLALAGIFSRHEEMWRYLAGCFHKATDSDRISKLPVALQSDGLDHRMGLLIGSEFGFELNYQTPVLSIGNSVPYSNQTLWLRLDLPELQNTTLDTLTESTWAIRKRIGEPPIILPPHARFLSLLSEDRKALVRQNLSWISAHPDLFREIITYHQHFRYPEIPDLDPDAALYQLGFLSSAEARVCEQFHLAAPAEKKQIIPKFPREEIRQLAARVLFRNYPQSAPSAFNPGYQQYMLRVNVPRVEEALCDYKGGRKTTPVEAKLEIDRLQREDSLDAEQRRLLTELRGYLIQTFG
ncbi:MAG: exonuclease domain-containing protein [Desulfobacterales bacterium]|jgi:exodeoxyribonuclease-1|nr:exonuclease domain-containing protein [Desulfobacterales bacterium]